MVSPDVGVGPEKLRRYYQRKYQMTDERFAEFVAERCLAHERYSARHRRA